MPVITHQAIAPNLHLKFGDGLREQIQKKRKFLPLAKQHLPVITPVKDMEIALLQQPPRDPRHPSLLPFSHSLNKKRCLSPFFPAMGSLDSHLVFFSLGPCRQISISLRKICIVFIAKLFPRSFPPLDQK